MKKLLLATIAILVMGQTVNAASSAAAPHTDIDALAKANLEKLVESQRQIVIVPSAVVPSNRISPPASPSAQQTTHVDTMAVCNSYFNKLADIFTASKLFSNEDTAALRNESVALNLRFEIVARLQANVVQRLMSVRSAVL